MHILRRRAQQQIPEHRRRQQDALRRRGGHGQHDVPQKPSRELVEHDQLPAARCHGKAVVTEHAVQLVAVQPRHVHEEARRERPGRRVHAQPPFGASLDACHGLVEAQLAAREHGLGGERERRREGTDDALVGNLERALGAGTEMRLSPVQLLDPELADGRIPVGLSPLDDARERGQLGLIPRDEQSAGALERYPRSGGVPAEQLVAAAHEARLDRPGLGVEAGVQQRRVRLAGPSPDVRGGVDQRAAQLKTG